MSLLYNQLLTLCVDTSLVDQVCLATEYWRPLLIVALTSGSGGVRQRGLVQLREAIAESSTRFTDVMFLTQVSG